jgi:GH24 family phage-related lysozyme (muramidase)
MQSLKSSLNIVKKVVVPSGPPTKISNLDLIKESEGLRLTAYLPTPNDRWTIGYGHTKTAKQGMVITAAKAEELLRQDVAWVEKVILDTVKVDINQNQFDALGSLIFNIGGTAFKSSSVLRRLNSGDYQGAADAFLMWTKQKNKTTGKMDTLKGLVIRRNKERDLFLK